MSLETVKLHLKKYGRENDIIIVDGSSATVLEAAESLNTEPDKIAKTLAISDSNGGCVVVVVSGNSRLDNAKYRSVFGYKPRMLSFEDTYNFTSHKVGGVCPFGLPEGTEVYLDVSIKKHDYVFPACGTGNSAIRLTIEELEKISNYKKWVDVCK